MSQHRHYTRQRLNEELEKQLPRAAEPQPAEKTYWVFVPATHDRDSKEKAEAWILQMQTRRTKPFKNYKYLSPSRNVLAIVKPDDVLYIHCHGGYFGTRIQHLYMESEKTSSSLKPKTLQPHTAKEFAAYLKFYGLNRNHRTLKIAACYSDQFAGDLFDELKAEYTQLTVYGYKGQLAVCQGNDYGKLAGLYPPEYVREGEGRCEVISAKIDDPAIKEQFRASSHRVGYGIKAQAEQKEAARSSVERIASARAEGAAAAGVSEAPGATPAGGRRRNPRRAEDKSEVAAASSAARSGQPSADSRSLRN